MTNQSNNTHLLIKFSPKTLIFFPWFLYDTNKQPPPATDNAMSSRGDVRLSKKNIHDIINVKRLIVA